MIVYQRLLITCDVAHVGTQLTQPRPGAQPSPVAKKRYRRARKASAARDDEETSASKEGRAMTQDMVGSKEGWDGGILEKVLYI